MNFFEYQAFMTQFPELRDLIDDLRELDDEDWVGQPIYSPMHCEDLSMAKMSRDFLDTRSMIQLEENGDQARSTVLKFSTYLFFAGKQYDAPHRTVVINNDGSPVELSGGESVLETVGRHGLEDLDVAIRLWLDDTGKWGATVHMYDPDLVPDALRAERSRASTMVGRCVKTCRDNHPDGLNAISFSEFCVSEEEG